MTTALAQRIQAHFGEQGIRRFTAGEMAGVHVPDAAVAQVIELGMPMRVGPYFTAAEADHPIALGAYASSIGFDVAETEPGEQATGRLRLGTDEGAEICVDATGRVQAVFVQADAPSMHVSSGVEAFAASLLTLDEYLPVLASPGRRNPAEVFREMRGRLLEIDAAAHEDDEAWWPRVLEQIRHALSFPFSAAFEVVEPDGRKHIETEQAQVGLPHPEQMLWAKLEARGVRPEQISRIYIELEPCFLPGNYCAMWLTMFPNAEISYSYPYGATMQEREEGFLQLMREAAEQG